MKTIISRSKEISLLNKILGVKKAQLVALYGRRRIGKTFIIRTHCQNKGLYIEIMGTHLTSLHDQLTLFAKTLSKTLFNNIPIKTPPNWNKAFELLTEYFFSMKKKQKIILFFDEVPWLASSRSKFLQTFDHYWNTQWSQIENLTVILCGSAASWMLEKLINAKGGLHNRINHTILLKPFNLQQTREFLIAKGFKLSHKQILDLYMVTGGIPYYLEHFQKSKSLTNNIQQLCFTEEGLLNKEFDRIFFALFDQAETSLRLMKAIASKRQGLSREALIKKTKIHSGGTLNKRLNELEAAGFIKSYIPYGYRKREIFYRVIDEYSLFYLKWIAPGNISGHGFTPNYWYNVIKTPAWHSWAGYSFETVCFNHIPEIIHALDLTYVGCQLGSWRFIPKKNSSENGAQIDLLFDCLDEVIVICEIKYSTQEYGLDKAEAKKLMKTLSLFEEKTKTRKSINIALITTHGLKPNVWSEDLINKVVTLDHFFSLQSP